MNIESKSDFRVFSFLPYKP